jgi:flagellar protein FlaG
MNPAPGPDERAVGVGTQRAAAGKPASVAAPVDSEEQPQAAPADERLSRAVESINTALQARSPELEFSVDSDSERMVVKVIDRDTKEVIRQMPSEEALEIAKALDRMQSLLIRQTA